MFKKLLALSLLIGCAVTAHAQQFKALLFTKTAGFHHVSIHEGVTGIRNLQRPQVEDHIQRLAISKTPLPAATFWAGIGLEFVGCALVLIDWYPAVGVLCLIVFTVAATALLLRFWEAGDPGKRTGMQNGLLANVGVAAVLVRMGAHVYPAAFAGIVIGSVWNYALSSRFVWGRFR